MHELSNLLFVHLHLCTRPNLGLDQSIGIGDGASPLGKILIISSAFIYTEKLDYKHVFVSCLLHLLGLG
jgi:hypothetical protein